MSSASRRSGSTIWTSLVINADALLDFAEFGIRFSKKKGVAGRRVRFPTPKSTAASSLSATRRRLYTTSATKR